MWLSGQQKRPAEAGESQIGTVTMDGGELAVLLDSERRGLEVYGPGGYRWTPQVGQRVMVIEGKGEIPCVVGVRENETAPKKVAIEAEEIDLRGQTLINGIPLEQYIVMIVAGMMGG